MRILVLGSGGREHTLVWKISQSEEVEKIFCVPGNGGTAKIADNVNIGVADVKKLVGFVKEELIDLTIVGPEAPLAEGIVDKFKNEGLKIFGPTREGAKLESSKVFAKQFMRKYNIPTAEFEVFDNKEEAIDFVKNKGKDIVVKTDGLAGGKGVFVCKDIIEAKEAINQIMVEKKFGFSGNRIVIEEKLIGEEASMIVLCDGKTILPLASSQDHKPIYDGDKGSNTGGMGAYSPAPVLSGGMFDQTLEKIISPLVKGIQSEIQTYTGILYVGLMVTEEGPYVLEFNVRFGDPEIQVIAPRLKSDLLEVIQATIGGYLDKVTLEWDDKSCVCVVMVSGGYPGKYEKGKVIRGIEEAESVEDVIVFHAGTKIQESEDRSSRMISTSRNLRDRQKTEEIQYVTDGGRVLGITALGDTIEEAIRRSYSAVDKIEFENAYFRKDIGYKALEKLRH